MISEDKVYSMISNMIDVNESIASIDFIESDGYYLTVIPTEFIGKPINSFIGYKVDLDGKISQTSAFEIMDAWENEKCKTIDLSVLKKRAS